MNQYIWHTTSSPGVRYREHPERKHGKKPDRYYYIRYRNNGKTVQEGLGWASKEGITQQKAAELRSEITANIRKGSGPQRLSEKRQVEQDRKEKEEQEKIRAAVAEEQSEIKNLTFKDIWPRYFELAESTKTPRTATTEKLAIEKWALPPLGKKRLVDICVLDLERLKKKMLDDGRAPRTIEYLMAMIRQVFNYAKDHGFFNGDNPARKVKKLKYDNKRQRFLTPAEADLLLKILKKKNTNLHDMALLSLHTGARAGEIFGLEWTDLDFTDGKITFRDTKNADSRYVFMSEAVKSMLKQRLKEADISKIETPYVFPNRKGHRIKDISRAFEQIILNDTTLNAGITDRRQKFTFHTLRHSAASWLVQDGTPLYIVQKLLGHKTASLTERYSHLAPANLRAVTAVFDKYTGTQNGEEPADDPDIGIHKGEGIL